MKFHHKKTFKNDLNENNEYPKSSKCEACGIYCELWKRITSVCRYPSLEFVGIHVLVRSYPPQFSSVLSLLRISESYRQHRLRIALTWWVVGQLSAILLWPTSNTDWTSRCLSLEKVLSAVWVFLGGATFARQSITTSVCIDIFLFLSYCSLLFHVGL